MTLFQFLWLRRLIRRHTRPVPEHAAYLWKRRLAFGYTFFAWNAFGFVCYMIYTGKSDWAHYYGYKSDEEASKTPAQQWTKILGIKDATVYRVSGFKIHKYEVHNDFDNKDQIKSNETVPNEPTDELLNCNVVT